MFGLPAALSRFLVALGLAAGSLACGGSPPPTYGEQMAASAEMEREAIRGLEGEYREAWEALVAEELRGCADCVAGAYPYDGLEEAMASEGYGKLTVRRRFLKVAVDQIQRDLAKRRER